MQFEQEQTGVTHGVKRIEKQDFNIMIKYTYPKN